MKDQHALRYPGGLCHQGKRCAGYPVLRHSVDHRIYNPRLHPATGRGKGIRRGLHGTTIPRMTGRIK